MPEPIYHQPGAYDLEHEGDTEDVEFFVRLAVRYKPLRVLELACGTGRVTIPLAEAGEVNGFHVMGLELTPEMLQAAEERRAALAESTRNGLELLKGDMRHWKA